MSLLSEVTTIALGLRLIKANTQKQETQLMRVKKWTPGPHHRKTKKSAFQIKMGELENYNRKLHIDPSEEPVAQRERRITCALRNKVNEELKQLKNDGIIEDITEEPTQWSNELVIVPKGEHNIQICKDMRLANEITTRT